MSLDRLALRKQLESYLIRHTRSGNHFFKSKFIADEIEGSAKQIGQEMRALQTASSELTIESWGGNSDGTTWYVRLNKE